MEAGSSQMLNDVYAVRGVPASAARTSKGRVRMMVREMSTIALSCRRHPCRRDGRTIAVVPMNCSRASGTNMDWNEPPPVLKVKPSSIWRPLHRMTFDARTIENAVEKTKMSSAGRPFTTVSRAQYSVQPSSDLIDTLSCSESRRWQPSGTHHLRYRLAMQRETDVGMRALVELGLVKYSVAVHRAATV